MKLLLVDTNKEIVEAWTEAFSDYPEVGFYLGRFEELDDTNKDWKVLVSAGNSFCIMGGGIDLAIARYFPGVEYKVQKTIKEDWFGKLNVGTAITLELQKFRGEKHYSLLIYTPTMRSPSIINNTDNVYLAMRAALIEYSKNHYPYEYDEFPLVIPGLGGQCGRVSPKSVAAQMKLAYKNFLERPIINTHIKMKIADLDVLNAVNK